jgi:hypothetical protein
VNLLKVTILSSLQWWSYVAGIANEYSSMMVMQNFLRTVHNVQQQYGLQDQEIMGSIILKSGTSAVSVNLPLVHVGLTISPNSARIYRIRLDLLLDM